MVELFVLTRLCTKVICVDEPSGDAIKPRVTLSGDLDRLCYNTTKENDVHLTFFSWCILLCSFVCYVLVVFLFSKDKRQFYWTLYEKTGKKLWARLAHFWGSVGKKNRRTFEHIRIRPTPDVKKLYARYRFLHTGHKTPVGGREERVMHVAMISVVQCTWRCVTCLALQVLLTVRFLL